MPQVDDEYKRRAALARFKQSTRLPLDDPANPLYPIAGGLGGAAIGTGVARIGGSILRSIVRKIMPSPAVIRSVTALPVRGSGLARIQRDFASLPSSKTRPAPAKKDTGTTPTGSSRVGYRGAPLPGSAAAIPRGDRVGTGNPPGPQLRDRK